MTLCEAIKIVVETIKENYDQGELEDGDFPELCEAVKVLEAEIK